MKQSWSAPILATLCVVAMSFGSGGAVHAQTPGLALPPYEILTIVRSLDFEPLDEPLRRGGTYRLRALDADGEEVRVVVDARRGRVISVTPLVELPPGHVRVPEPAYLPGPRYAPPPPYGFRGPRILIVPDDVEEFDGPRVIYGPNLAPPRTPPRPAARPQQKAAAPARPSATARAPAQVQSEPPSIEAPSSQFEPPPVQPLDVAPLPQVDAPPVQGLN